MRDDRDFAMNAEDPKPADDSTASSPASPMVVIEYRRGLSAVLAPPVLILLATLVILSYQRQTPIRPIATARPTADSTPKDPAGRGRIIMVESSGAGAAFEPIAARAETRFGPPAPPASPPAPAPLAVASLTPAPTAPVAEAPKPVGEAEAEGAPSPFDLDRPNDQPPPPAPERAIEGEPVPHGGRGDGHQAPPAPRRGAFVVEPPPPPPPAPEPVAAPVHPEAPTAVARAEPEAPRPTKEQILDDIRREAEQKKAEQKQMDLLKLQARGLQLYETYQKAQAGRVPFRNDLRLLIETLGNQAGPEINQLCEQYGRTTAKEIHEGVRLDLFRSAARLTWRRKVELMRARGLPEPMILDFLAHELDWMKGARGGPRDEDEVRVRAARLLLSFPIAPPPPSPTDPAPPRAGARPSAKSVAGVAPASGPGPVRRSQ